MKFTPDGKSIIIGADGKYIIDFTQCAKEHRREKILQDPLGNAVTSVEYGPRGNLFVSGSSDSSMILYDKSGQKVRLDKERSDELATLVEGWSEAAATL